MWKYHKRKERERCGGGLLSAPRAPNWVMGYDIDAAKNPSSHDLLIFFLQYPKKNQNQNFDQKQIQIQIQGSLQTQTHRTRIDITKKLKVRITRVTADGSVCGQYGVCSAELHFIII